MFILRYLGINMKEITRAILLKVPIELDNEIIQYTKGKYRSRQEFILECIREKLKEGGI
ncbi:MAG: hypothetical protein RXO36_03215 [Candidatus Nanopusillus acidilobi]